ncbi:protein of unknown function [Haloechinothrix alba]|uniref:DUF4190 domain-containing protein n=1 Tax=Haloechinothrix alba TaxID=664784 RepID=A0A239ADY0_9PSEU|nr:DUF4190 domain-containing protein [Haloechinothrix alba]SNR93561.1 protein of unknown function [Haloechinothrix alba]
MTEPASNQPPEWQQQPQPGVPPQYYYPHPAPTPTNGMAIASLVLGILWLYWLGSVLAVIFGHVALRQTAERGDGGRGLAIAGLVLGYVGLGVLVAVLVIVTVAVGFSA